MGLFGRKGRGAASTSRAGGLIAAGEAGRGVSPRAGQDRSRPGQAEEKERAFLPAEEVRRIRRIHIRTWRTVDTLFAGEYTSTFKGRGMEFEEVREYVPGDDIRCIDWNVTARAGRPFVKQFREERELTLMLLVDVSLSHRFGHGLAAAGGERSPLKRDLVALMAAALAFAAIKSSDRVGLACCTDQVESYLQPRKGRGHIWRVIREIYRQRPDRGQTDLAVAFDFLGKVLHKRSVVAVFSDFLTGRPYDRALGALGRRHDLHAFVVADPLELALPGVGLLDLVDAETGEARLLDTAGLRREKGQDRRSIPLAADDLAARVRLLSQLGAQVTVARTDEPFDRPLIEHFRQRRQTRPRASNRGSAGSGAPLVRAGTASR